ncbi:MAG: MFS transporter [Sphingomonadaceae bacterium]|nr:MFS transporter [Sphingomonadaceae bacterium]
MVEHSGAQRSGAAILPRRGLVAVLIGNALEFYDFLTFAFFAPQIGRCFFPGTSEEDRLLLALATFGAGFLTRPVGGMLLGRFADRRGRRPALLLSFALMGVAIAGVGLTPGYATIGIAAPLLVLAFRLMQGFALGGDVGAATAYLIECAPPDRRGRFVSLQYVTQESANIVAGAIGAALAALLSPAALDGWGWRVPFLLGACIVPIGLVLRGQLHETLPADDATTIMTPGSGVDDYRRAAALGFVLLACGTIMTYGKLYITIYAEVVLHMRVSIALAATAVVGLAGMIGSLLSGTLSDRFGRKPVILVAGALVLVTTVPGFAMLGQQRTFATLLTVSGLVSLLVAIAIAPVLVGLTETLPARVRAGTVAIIYAFAIAVFGGSTQFLVAWLTKLSGSRLVPAWYMSGAALVSLAAALLLRESAPRVLRARRIARLRAPVSV